MMSYYDPLASRDTDELGLDGIAKDHALTAAMGAGLGMLLLVPAVVYSAVVGISQLVPRR